MPRQNLYVKDRRSRTTSIRVNPLLYDAVRQQGGNVEDILETALSAFLHVPSEVMVQLEERLTRLECCYAKIREGQTAALEREFEKMEVERQEKTSAEGERQKLLEAVYGEMESFPESGRWKVEQDIAVGGECANEEKLVLLLLKRLRYSENEIRGAVRVIVRSGWKVPEK